MRSEQVRLSLHASQLKYEMTIEKKKDEKIHIMSIGLGCPAGDKLRQGIGVFLAEIRQEQKQADQPYSIRLA
jgi:hypothetical protein